MNAIREAQRAYRDLHARYQLAKQLHRKGHISDAEFHHVRAEYRRAVVVLDRAEYLEVTA